MIPCLMQMVVVDRVEEGVLVLEVGHALVAVELAGGSAAAGAVREGSQWQVCLVPPPTMAGAPSRPLVAVESEPRATPR